MADKLVKKQIWESKLSRTLRGNAFLGRSRRSFICVRAEIHCEQR